MDKRDSAAFAFRGGWAAGWILESAIVAIAYLAAARLGQSVAIPPGNVTAVWPPSGIALAAVLLRGRRVLPGIWLAGMVANMWPFFDAGRPLAALVFGAAIGTGVLAQACAGAAVARAVAGGADPLRGVRDTVRFLTLASAPVCLISATVGTMSLWLGGITPGGDVRAVWLTWFLGDTAGVILFAPFALAWAQRPVRPPRRGAALEALLCGFVVLGILAFVFGQERWFGVNYPLLFLVLPGLMWAAFRLDPRGATAVLIVVSSFAVWNTARGQGPLAQADPEVSLLLLESFFVVVSGPVLVVVAAAAERRRVNEEIDKLREELTYSARVTSLGEMAGGLAHELGQPLGAIMNNARAVLRGQSTGRLDAAEIGAGLAAITTEAERATDTIRSLRALASRSAPQLVPTDLDETLHAIVRLFVRGDPRAASVRIHTEEGIPPVAADPVQFQQAILNLLQNAGDAMKAQEERLIEVRSELEPEGVHVRVIDRGAGMPADQLSRVFDSFYTTKQDGLGLGLRITRLIVEAHGGKIWMTLNPDRGVTAHVTVPIASRITPTR